MILLPAPNFSQTKEFYLRCRRLHDKYEFRGKPYLITDSKSSTELSNGSRLVVISGGNEVSHRSFRSNLVICDELAHYLIGKQKSLDLIGPDYEIYRQDAVDIRKK